MADATYDEGEMGRDLGQLDKRSRVAFGLSCAERMLPNYRAFVREQRWGDVTILRRALDRAWSWLGGEPLTDDLVGLRRACEAQAPDTEDYDSILVSSALDAANAAALVLDLIQTGDVERAVEVSTLARDTVDMYVQEIAGILPTAADLEERIRLHPLMQEEIARQLADLQLLRGSWTVGQIRHWFAPEVSNIGIG